MLIRLGIDEVLYRTVRTTNPIENMNGQIVNHTRNVKRWQGSELVLRWIACALEDAAHGF